MPPKIIFRGYFGKYCFLKKLLYEKYAKPHFLQNSLYIIFLSPNTPFPSKWSCPLNGFSQFFQHKLKNIREVFRLNVLNRKKTLWRINFVLIKFSPNALFLKNYRMNAKFHYFSIRLCVLGQTTQAQLSRFTFMTLYSRMLWFCKHF